MTEDIEFNEFIYLNTHEDVRLAVARGDFASGRDHFEKYGKAEGRMVSSFFSQQRIHFLEDYRRLVKKLIAENPNSPETSMAIAVGSPSLEHFNMVGDRQVQLLLKEGLQPGMTIYDLACGSGRTAQALKRHGWRGSYRGADIIEELISYAAQKTNDFEFFVHHDFSIFGDADSFDLIFAWSLFTHLYPEESYLYLRDIKRKLKSGGIFLFSFLEIDKTEHWEIFKNRVTQLAHGVSPAHLDYFFDRTMIEKIVAEIGLDLVKYIDGDDPTASPLGCFGQSIAIVRKS